MDLDFEEIKFVLIMLIPFVLFIALIIVLVFYKRIPSPTFPNILAKKMALPVTNASLESPSGIKVGSMQADNGLDEVRALMQSIQTGKKSRTKKFLILAISLIFFAVISKAWFSLYSWYGISILIVVMLIHEMGHFIAMKKFGYRDPHIFFIPLVGAAAAGTEAEPKGTHKAIVSLLGPVPGILLGILFGIVYLQYRNSLFLGLSAIFLFLNGLNLLPLFPLDGGHFFEAILFARNRKIEIVFKAMPSIVLLGLALYSHQWLFAIFAFLILISLPTHFRIISVAADTKSLNLKSAGGKQEISDEMLKNIVTRLKNKLPIQIQTPKQLARFAHIVWQKINFKPPNIKETMALFLIYIIFLSAAVFSSYFVLSKAYNKKLVVFQDEKGVAVKRELSYIGDLLLADYEVSNKNLYHGKAVNYMAGRIVWKGQYYEGKMDGEWTHYDMDGNKDRIVLYEKGRFITEKRLTEMGWHELRWENLTEKERKSYLKHERGNPRGPKSEL